MLAMAVSKWALDPTHSGVEFSIKHMMISKVKGSFNKFDATIEADPADLTTAKIEFTVDLSSVDTNNADRDNHLRSADFFDVETYPQLTFAAKSIVRKSDDAYAITGDLTMHGVTRTETLTATFEGTGKDPWGNEKAGFSVEGTLKRSDYGLTWNAALETGGFLVGDDVKISADIQAVKQA